MEQTENQGWKNTLEKAKINKQFVKLLFLYPGAQRRTIKSGHVKATYDDCFDFDESFDGHTTYSYKFITAVINPESKVEAESRDAPRPNIKKSSIKEGDKDVLL